MSGSDSAPSLGLLARLLLWLAVLVAGFLYLGAIYDRRETKDDNAPPSAERTPRGVTDSQAAPPPGEAVAPAPASIDAARQRAPAAAPQPAGAASGGSAAAVTAFPPGGSAEPAESDNRLAGTARVLAQATGAEVAERDQQGGAAAHSAQRTPRSDVTPAEAEAFAKAVISEAASEAGSADEPPAVTTGSAAAGESPSPASSAAATVGTHDGGPSRAEKPAAARERGVADDEVLRWRAYQEMLRRRSRATWPGWPAPYPLVPPGPFYPRGP